MRPDVLTMAGMEAGRRFAISVPARTREENDARKKSNRYLSALPSSTRIPTPRSCCQRSLKRLQIFLIWCKAPRCKCILTFASPRGAAAGVSRRPVPHTAARTQGSLTPSPRVLVVLA